MRESPKHVRKMSQGDDLKRCFSGTSDLLNFESLDSYDQQILQIEDTISDLVLGQDDQTNSIEPKSDKHVFEYQQSLPDSKEICQIVLIDLINNL